MCVQGYEPVSGSSAPEALTAPTSAAACSPTSYVLQLSTSPDAVKPAGGRGSGRAELEPHGRNQLSPTRPLHALRRPYMSPVHAEPAQCPFAGRTPASYYQKLRLLS